MEFKSENKSTIIVIFARPLMYSVSDMVFYNNNIIYTGHNNIIIDVLYLM